MAIALGTLLDRRIAKASMYVVRLQLHNIRLFGKLDLRFDTTDKSVLFLGDNGDGKSTILRSLAIGLCDQSSASALFRELSGEYVKRGCEKAGGKIIVDLADTDGLNYRIVTRIYSTDSFERLDQTYFRWKGGRKSKLTQDNFPWHRIFASAYGAGLRTQGSGDVSYYLTVDAVYPLFRYDVQLQNPELVIRRLTDHALSRRDGSRRAKRLLQDLKELLKRLLQLSDEDSITLTETGIEVAGPWGRTDMGSLGDGYRATLTWILDLISWWFIKERENKQRHEADVRGVVIVDEIEQHLHPRWQRNILKLLTSNFPHVQFITTTHSPLVASGCEDIAVHVLSKGELSPVDPYGWLAEDVYRAMGLPTSRAADFSSEIEEFAQLDRLRLDGNASDINLERLSTLHDRLDALPGTDVVALQTRLNNMKVRLSEAARKRKAKK